MKKKNAKSKCNEKYLKKAFFMHISYKSKYNDIKNKHTYFLFNLLTKTQIIKSKMISSEATLQGKIGSKYSSNNGTYIIEIYMHYPFASV